MKCLKCGGVLLEGSKFCSKCGESIEMGEKIEKENKEVFNVKYFAIPVEKLAALSILTWGIYEIYWFYKNWEGVRIEEKRKMYPFWRAILSIFYCHSLFKKILGSAKKQGYSENYSAGLLAFLYIVSLLLARALGQVENPDLGFNLFWVAISFSSFVPLIWVQRATNFNNSKIVEGYNNNLKFSAGEVVIMIVGALCWGVVFIGIFA